MDIRKTEAARILPARALNLFDNRALPYALLSDAAYEFNKRVNVPGYRRLFGNNTGSVFQNERTGGIVIAYKGSYTEKDRDADQAIATGTDFIINPITGQIDMKHEQFKDGEEVFLQYREKYPIEHLTGHSLGGSIAQLLSYKYKVPADVFNAGMGDNESYKKGLEKLPKYRSLVSHQVLSDDASYLNRDSLGTVKSYAPLEQDRRMKDFRHDMKQFLQRGRA